jgi:hypothetical protein
MILFEEALIGSALRPESGGGAYFPSGAKKDAKAYKVKDSSQ